MVLSTEGIFENIVYCSVTSYYLSIEQHFPDNKFLSSVNDTYFSCYSKCGGENTGIKVIFHIRNKKGHIFNISLKTFDLDTEPVYVDGSATPFLPLSTLKEKNTP